MKRIVTTMLATALLAAAGCALMGPEYVEPAEYDLAQPPSEEIRRSGETVRLGGTVYRFELDRKRKLAVVGVDYSARLSDGASLERNTLCEAPIRDDSPAAAVRAMSEAVERSAAAAKQLVLELLKGAGEEKPASLTNGTETK